MPGISREVIEHALKIRPGSKPVKQLLCCFDEEKRMAIGEEMEKVDPIVVRKKSGKLRMCVDYTGLNKACPKDPFPLPRIDQVVDSTSGRETLCFLIAYSGSPGTIKS